MLISQNLFLVKHSIFYDSQIQLVIYDFNAESRTNNYFIHRKAAAVQL